MNIKKNYFKLLLTLALALTALVAVGCGGGGSSDKAADTKKTGTVTTSF